MLVRLLWLVYALTVDPKGQFRRTGAWKIVTWLNSDWAKIVSWLHPHWDKQQTPHV